MEVLNPGSWTPPVGYANGIAARPGRIVFVADLLGTPAKIELEATAIVPDSG